jgi:hypothetical protein
MNHYKLIIPIAATVLLNSCITAERCNERFPVEREIKTYYKDTVIVTETRTFDTLVQYKRLDTLIIHDHQTDIRTELMFLPGDSIFVETTCPPDTVRVEKVLEIIKEKAIQQVDETKNAIRWIAIFCFALFLAIASVAYLIKTIRNK